MIKFFLRKIFVIYRKNLDNLLITKRMFDVFRTNYLKMFSILEFNARLFSFGIIIRNQSILSELLWYSGFTKETGKRIFTRVRSPFTNI